jgi:hypothetical protein
MALIGKIRKQSWLLMVVIGLALLGFLLMDSIGQGMGGGSMPAVVEVDGNEVDWAEFQNAERILYTGSSADVFSRRNYLYNYFVDRAIVGEEAKVKPAPRCSANWRASSRRPARPKRSASNAMRATG